LDTKLKGLKAVKIICFILILAFCFTAASRVISTAVTYAETNINPDIVFADLSTNQYFFEKHVDTYLINHSFNVLARLKSEESIKAGEYLMWFEHYNVYTRDSFGYNYYHQGSSHQLDSNNFPDTVINAVPTTPSPGDVDWEFNGEFADDFYVVERWLQLKSPDEYYFYVSIPLTVSTTMDELYKHEANAIKAQLYLYHSAQEQLNRIEGLLYYLSVETTSPGESETTFIVYSNVDVNVQDAEYFKSFPVHFIMSRADFDFYAISQVDNFSVYFRNFDPDIIGDGELFLAFTPDVVDVQNQLFATARNIYVRDLTIFVISIILVLGLTIVLMVVAGRKYIVIEEELTKANKVHFIPIDKPYLDISLAILIGWTVLVGYFTVRVLDTVWYHMNVTAMNLVLLAAILLIMPFVLIWLTSLAKRIRAGKFLRHTLIYAILYHCIFCSLRFFFRFIKSLWAGTRLTFKVTVISCAAFFTMFFIVFVAAESRAYAPLFFLILLLTAVIAVLLLMYARRIRRLEQGARDAAQGKNYSPIEAGSGELGNIANSINNISAGINKAVEERMKSERLKTELITNVSHDIRTPLTSIITYTDLLEHEGLDCEKAPEYLEVLKQKSLRLKTLTDELFEAAKAATGNIDANLADLNIVSLINQVLGELDSAVKSSGFDLRVNLPDKLLAIADGRLMQRVLENLLSNVFKYSLPGSRVYLDAAQADAFYVRIELKNISSQELNFDPSELTERFKRGDESRADGGSGLGLSIVQSFIDAQGGMFNVSIDGDLFKATVLLPTPPITPSLPLSPTHLPTPAMPNTSP